MSLAHARLCAELFDRPHLYHPGKAETFVRLLGPRLTGQSIVVVNAEGGVDHRAFASGRPSAGVLGDRMGRAWDRVDRAPFDMVGSVAVIPIEGTLVHKGGWLGSESGETSYQGLQVQIARARSRPEVRGIVFEVDSFGGMVNGAFETAAMMRALSKEKPTIAILTDHAYSAGYLLASQARQVIVPEFGGAGSIGVVMMHADLSGQLEQEGIRVTLIHAGRHKVDGHPALPLDPDERDRWQAKVDALRERFAAEVGRGRAGRMTKAAALKTEAQAFTAGEALTLGLVDAIGDPVEAFDAFVKEINRS